ncbi:hypothetical protein ES703_47144 [subsurface metagenome]
MKKGKLFSFLALFVFLVLIAMTVIPSEGFDDKGIITQRMMELGFQVDKIDQLSDGSYKIKVKSFRAKTKVVTLRGIFRPFEVRAKFSQGILFLEKSDLEKAGFVINDAYLPSGIKIVNLGLARPQMQPQLGMRNPDIQRIEQALAKIKQNRTEALAKFDDIKRNIKEANVLLFPDVCKTPQAPSAVPIPYPNIAKSSDTASGSKKVKMNQSEVMLKNSSNFKMSMGDEAGSVANLTNLLMSRSRTENLSDKDKASFKNKLTTHLAKAISLANEFDKYIEDLDLFLQKYKSVKD